MKQEARDLLREAGLKATEPRLQVLTILRKAIKPLQPKQMLARLGKAFDQATLYRVLGSFKEAGLIRQVDLRGDAPFYEIRPHGDDHHHIVCTECGKIADFEACLAEGLEEEAMSQAGGFSEITGHSFEFFGICKECKKKAV